MAYDALMDPRFLPHNTHLDEPDRFDQLDPQLRWLGRQTYVHRSSLLQQLPRKTPGIYILGGGRQIGKTTLLKQWMSQLIDEGVPPRRINFILGELIDDHHALLSAMKNCISGETDHLFYLLIDEITFIHNWDKAIKYAADSGQLENVILLVTGSDLSLIREARMRFPGRRGKASVTDFHLHPLSFREYVLLIDDKNFSAEASLNSTNPPRNLIDALYSAFQHYLIHGGYLTAINEYADNDHISESTLNTYSDWIRGDMQKRGKQEIYLREILSAIIQRYNSQITWNNLARDLSIDHPKTVSDYVSLLASMDALYIQSALLEDKLTASPKKAKKLVFLDSFIFHAVKSWLYPTSNPYKEQILTCVNDPILSAGMVEACVVSHYQRFYPTYYIKAKGEVDVVYIKDGKIWPVEVKWRNQLRPKDLKQIRKYPNGLILTKSRTPGEIFSVQTMPLPLALFNLS